MIFSRLWIIQKLVFVILFLMADIIFKHRAVPCMGFHLQSKENSTENTEVGGVEFNFLNNYFNSVLNKSRALEEVIYSDILNNLRSLLKTGNNQSVLFDKKEYKKHDVSVKSEKIDCDNRNKTGSKKKLRIPVNSYKTNVFLSGANEIINMKGSSYVFANVTAENSGVQEDEYLLGYSGNPFGSRRPITGIVEVPENDAFGRQFTDPRKKRSVLHLYNMVLCTTGCNPFTYKGYGCYCGFLGSGFVVDGIDSCCKMHDWCYNSAGCPMFLEYFIPYLWKCYHRQPLCAIDHGYYGGPGSCAQRLCECDRQLALCLRRFPCPSTKALCTSSPWSNNLKMSEKEKLREEYQKVLEEEAKIMSKILREEAEKKFRRRKDFVKRLELERREANLNGVVLKAKEVSALQDRQLEQEEKLAAEMDFLRRQEIVEMKMRQHLRENSHELKELERQLRAAYRNKELAAQLAEKEAHKLEDQIREKRAREVLEKAVGTLQEQEEELRLKEQKQKDEFRYSLQDQIIEKEMIRQKNFISFMNEKKLSDDILQAIKDEEVRQMEEKKYMQQKIREEMEQFYKARKIWKAREKLTIQEEEEKRRQINEEKAKVAAENEALKKFKKDNLEERFFKMSSEMEEKMRKKAEREELVTTLMFNMKEEEEKRKSELEKEAEIARKREARAAFKELQAAKTRKQKEEKELDAQFARLMQEKINEEEKKEREKLDQRRNNLINNRKYNEEAMRRNVQKRAEHLKLTQLINEIEEKEEKRKAELIEEERIRILRQHAPKLLGYFPKGCLQEKDLEILGITGNSPLPESSSLTKK